MGEIKLDPKKLLGFKIIATGESMATLHSPKIGGKGCAIVGAAEVPIVTSTPISAKIGGKV